MYGCCKRSDVFEGAHCKWWHTVFFSHTVFYCTLYIMDRLTIISIFTRLKIFSNIYNLRFSVIWEPWNSILTKGFCFLLPKIILANLLGNMIDSNENAILAGFIISKVNFYVTTFISACKDEKKERKIGQFLCDKYICWQAGMLAFMWQKLST